MKKCIICIMAAVMLASNVYAEDMWFLLTPTMDSRGDICSKDNFKNVKGVEVKFKIIEMIDEIIKSAG